MADDSGKEILSCRFKSETGEILGDVMDLPANCTLHQLTSICNALLEQEEPVPYIFYINEKEVTNCLQKTLDISNLNTEEVIDIVYQQQAVFRVRPVTRCTSSMPGHAEAVLSVNFSPDGLNLASGSGDTTVRFWDVHTQSPLHTCKGHKNWVLCVSWSPDSKKVASACKDGKVIIWDPFTGKQMGKTMVGHKQWITSLSWEPYHQNPECRLLASSSKDGDVRIWDTVLCNTLLTISGHLKSVTVVKWGGSGLIYTASQDRTVKVWRAKDGILCRTLEGHGHWVNTLALNTDYILKIGAFDPVKDSNRDTLDGNKKKSQDFALKSEFNLDSAQSCLKKMCRKHNLVPVDKLRQWSVGSLYIHEALGCSPNNPYFNSFWVEGWDTKYKELTVACTERLVSGSDDFTMFLWDPSKDKKPIARLTGHQQLVIDVKFSPDARILASASFDKSIRLWQAKTGKYIATLRGHVQAVYMVAFSADSRMMVSGSADSTLKLWNLKTNKLEIDLPGHADEVFAVDWATDGSRVASGGKDKVLKLWQY